MPGQSQARIERDDRGAELRGREARDHELGAGGQDQRDPVPGLDPEILERCGQ